MKYFIIKGREVSLLRWILEYGSENALWRGGYLFVSEILKEELEEGGVPFEIVHEIEGSDETTSELFERALQEAGLIPSSPEEETWDLYPVVEVRYPLIDAILNYLALRRPDGKIAPLGLRSENNAWVLYVLKRDADMVLTQSKVKPESTRSFVALLPTSPFTGEPSLSVLAQEAGREDTEEA